MLLQDCSEEPGRQLTGKADGAGGVLQIHQNSVSRIQAVPDRTVPHTRCTPSLLSLQEKFFCKSSSSLSGPPHSFCSVTTSSCSLCNGVRLPSPPHPHPSPHCPVWNQQEVTELRRPHRLTSPPETLYIALSQVLNSPEEYGSFSAHTMVLPSYTLGSHCPYQ